MMKVVKVITLSLVAALCASSLFAVDDELLKGLPRGLQNIKYDKGVISTLVVVGKAAIPKALRRNPGRAAQYGGEKARDNAQLEFTRFLSTTCKWGRNAQGETVVKQVVAAVVDTQGNESSAESAEFTEIVMTREQKEQSAKACVSGIQVLWEGLDNNGLWTWVGAWNARTARSLAVACRPKSSETGKVQR